MEAIPHVRPAVLVAREAALRTEVTLGDLVSVQTVKQVCARYSCRKAKGADAWSVGDLRCLPLPVLQSFCDCSTPVCVVPADGPDS